MPTPRSGGIPAAVAQKGPERTSATTRRQTTAPRAQSYPSHCACFAGRAARIPPLLEKATRRQLQPALDANTKERRYSCRRGPAGARSKPPSQHNAKPLLPAQCPTQTLCACFAGRAARIPPLLEKATRRQLQPALDANTKERRYSCRRGLAGARSKPPSQHNAKPLLPANPPTQAFVPASLAGRHEYRPSLVGKAITSSRLAIPRSSSNSHCLAFRTLS